MRLLIQMVITILSVFTTVREFGVTENKYSFRMYNISAFKFNFYVCVQSR